MMQKNIIAILSVFSALAFVLYFMTQNTRFESNILKCKQAKNNFQITYASLQNGAPVSFEKNDQALTNISISNVEKNSFHFKHQYSDFKLDLDKLIASEFVKGEILLYSCDLKKFKM